MKLRKSLIVTLFMAVLISSALIAGGARESTKVEGAPSKVQLTFWTNAATNRAWMEEMARRYNDANPNLEFSLEVSQFPAGELAQKIIGSMIAGSSVPDLVSIQTPDIAKYLKGGFAESDLYDLKELLPNANFNHLIYDEQWQWEGKQYAINMDTSISIYYYRKDIMDSVGIQPDTWETWDDYIRDGLILKEKTGSFMSVQDIGGWNQYMILMYMNEGGLFDKDGNNVMDSPENAEALQLWIDLVKKYQIHWPTSSFYGPGTTEAQREGLVAGVIIPEWYHAQYLLNQLPELAGDWRIAKLPAFAPGKPRTAHRGGTAIGVTQSTKYPDVVRDFMMFCFFSVENRRETYLMPEMGQFPSYVPSLADPELLSFRFPYFGNQLTAQLLAEVAADIPPYYANPYLAEAFDILNTIVLPPVVNGTKAPQAALNDGKIALDKVMGR